MNNKPNFKYEKLLEDPVIGVDEVGRGCIAGPVVSCACIIFNYKLPNKNFVLINDSKKLTKNKRQEAFKKILTLKKNKIIDFSLGYSNVKEIDKFNILEATKMSMIRAINKIKYKKGNIIVDGKMNLKVKNFKSKNIIKGDQKSISIAAASIIAKIHRDKYMYNLWKKINKYDWHLNSGYGTQSHINQLLKYGISIHHRKSFEPIKSLIHN